jgi:hypothetical protein
MNLLRFFSLPRRLSEPRQTPAAMDKRFQEIVSKVEPIPDSIYGPRYRCSLSLKDGTEIPCAVLQSKAKLIELAKRRIKEEMSGHGKIAGPDPYGQILSSFVARGNCVNDYDVASVAPSRYAIPLSLLNQIHGETTMGWTGWVFEMKDGSRFAYGSSFLMEFFDVPEGQGFDDVAKVHNHSFLSPNGKLVSLEQGSRLPSNYSPEKIFRERIFFTCYIEGL